MFPFFFIRLFTFLPVKVPALSIIRFYLNPFRYDLYLATHSPINSFIHSFINSFTHFSFQLNGMKPLSGKLTKLIIKSNRFADALSDSSHYLNTERVLVGDEGMYKYVSSTCFFLLSFKHDRMYANLIAHQLNVHIFAFLTYARETFGGSINPKLYMITTVRICNYPETSFNFFSQTHL